MNLSDLDMSDSRICPKCYSTVREKDGVLSCPKCGHQFRRGDRLVLPLRKALKLADKERMRKMANMREKTRRQHGPKNEKKPHSTGFYGVSRVNPTKVRPDGAWRYRSKKYDLEMKRTNLKQLKKDVLKNGGLWEVVDKEKAKETWEEDQ